MLEVLWDAKHISLEDMEYPNPVSSGEAFAELSFEPAREEMQVLILMALQIELLIFGRRKQRHYCNSRNKHNLVCDP